MGNEDYDPQEEELEDEKRESNRPPASFDDTNEPNAGIDANASYGPSEQPYGPPTR